jgi:glycosyltransferase involved in cell wall biosynthesis
MNHVVKVTVGICVKNSESTIKQAMESVLNQDFPHELMEILIVDGYSQDNTLKIVKEILKNKDVHVKIFREREGLGRARQIVVENAHGEYILWIDGDMILSKDFVKKQVEFMDNNPAVGIAKGKYGIVKYSENKSIVAFLEDLEFILSTRRVGEVKDKVLATSGCIYRTKAIRGVGGFDPSIKGVGEDIDAEGRVKAAGWKLYITSAIFQEIRRKSWRALWNEYVWHGRGARHLFSKNKLATNLYKAFPLTVIFTKIFQIPLAYKLTRRKAVLFIPLHYIFKRCAWFLGFILGCRY